MSEQVDKLVERFRRLREAKEDLARMADDLARDLGYASKKAPDPKTEG